jgi:Na+/pantothenate symporter
MPCYDKSEYSVFSDQIVEIDKVGEQELIILLLALTVILFLTATRTQFFKRKHLNNKIMTQLGMAILVAATTTNIFFMGDGNTAFKYTIVGMGLMSFIAILVEMIITKKKRTHKRSGTHRH